MTACNRCGHSWAGNEEKMTDVNIAVHLLIDAIEDKYDVAMLISGDSDLVPPIIAVQNKFPDKRVIVGFPPERHNNGVKQASRGSFIIGRQKLIQSQFPDIVINAQGYAINKPLEWT